MNDIFKSLIWDALIKLALTQLFKAIPFLGWGPIGWIVSMIAVYFGNKLYDVVEMFINFKMIIFNNEKLHREYVDASINLKNLAEINGIDSEEFKDAREKHKKSLSALIRFDAGSE